jgi:hypothetical protein
MSQPELKDYRVGVTVEFDLTFAVEAEDEDAARDLAEAQAEDHDLGAMLANIHCHEVKEIK